MDTFGTLDESGKARVVDYIQAASNGEDAKNRIETAVNSLSDGRLPG
jgi:hypothetical protein